MVPDKRRFGVKVQVKVYQSRRLDSVISLSSLATSYSLVQRQEDRIRYSLLSVHRRAY